MWYVGLMLLAWAADAPGEVCVLTLGDSITRGVRPGVTPAETFQAQLQVALRERKRAVRVVNAGVGGERTDQGLKRLPALLKTHRPGVVVIMYGHNDSHIDRGRSEPRLAVDDYRANLRKLVALAREAGAQVVLMTPPCYSRTSRQGGVNENPNVQLARYAAATREVARERKAPLADHYAHWHGELDQGRDVQPWTTDGYHPNARGHAELVRILLPVLARTGLTPAP